MSVPQKEEITRFFVGIDIHLYINNYIYNNLKLQLCCVFYFLLYSIQQMNPLLYSRDITVS